MSTTIKDSRERSDSLKMLQNYGKSTNTVTNVVNGVKFVGKIKLIQQAESPKEKTSQTDNKINMADELSYIQQMKESVVQRAHVFKEAEQEYNKEQQSELRVASTKLQKQIMKDEKIRLKSKREAPRSTEPDYIAKERQMYEKVEQAFLQHQNKRGIPPVNHHMTNKNQSDRHLITDCQSESVIKQHVIEDDQSDDSGLSGDTDSLCSFVDKERDLIEQTEEMFQKFEALHKQSTASDLSKMKTSVSVEAHQPASKADSTRNSLISENSNFVKDSLLVRLQIAERNAVKSKENYFSWKIEGRLDDALDAEEDYHAFSLEVSKLKKKILQLEKESSNGNETATRRGSKTETISTTVTRECKLGYQIKKSGNEFVDKSCYNDDGDCVPEGIINHRRQVYQSS
ncbi:uncharacterized protein [Clytia hemisphaerica]|uniref:Uncharacterized protein n=1 Tax=Clytia hemisphaerica TaxID=252671 RepID=A0A7M5V6Z3_9CNID